MAPETFLRVLDRIPTKVAYVQPSRRPPTDATAKMPIVGSSTCNCKVT